MDFVDKLILAPMAGVCDQPFRLLCKEMGCDILYTEMISAKAIYYGNRNTEPLLAISRDEAPIGVQLFGSEPELMAEMARRIEDRGYAFVDVNMGCPVPKIVNNGEGSALMKNPALIGRIVETMVKAVKLPVTVKIRSGFDSEHINAPEIARIVCESGAAAVAVHGRTRQQYYQGKADWDVIARVKEACSIPVIGNGDICSPWDITAMRQKTGCDSFMIGRAARGNPWIFRDIKHFFKYGVMPERPSNSELMDMMLRHARLMVGFKGEYAGIHEMRKHVAWYSAGRHDSARLRRRVNEADTYAELEEMISEWAADADKGKNADT